ncbi:MAG: hypothetical protein JO071_05760 [Deltaproteobacteria bacterium]|nr:hypothetical protein [Deltaproteobacteria bacterium]
MSKDPREPILLTDDSAIPAPPARVRAGLETLPAAIATAGARTSERFIDFFTANIRNRNTRMAYAVAVRQFFNCVGDDQTPGRRRRPALFHLLSYISRDRYQHILAERGHAGACPADRRA